MLSVAYTFDTDAYADSIRAVAATGGEVYFYNRDEHTIRQLGKDTPIFPTMPDGNEFKIRDNHIWFTQASRLFRYDLGQASSDLGTGTVDGCIFVDAQKTTVFAADFRGRLISVPYASGGETLVLTNLDQPWGVAVTDTRLFYTKHANQIVWRSFPNPGSGGETTLIDKLENPQCLTVAGEFLYFPTYEDGKIHRIRFDGSDHTILEQGQQHPTQIAVANGALYWNSGTKVMRLGPAQ